MSSILNNTNFLLSRFIDPPLILLYSYHFVSFSFLFLSGVVSTLPSTLIFHDNIKKVVKISLS